MLLELKWQIYRKYRDISGALDRSILPDDVQPSGANGAKEVGPFGPLRALNLRNWQLGYGK